MIKCDNCQKEINYNELDIFNIKISSDTSYRYGRMFLCVGCSEKSDIYTIEPFSKSLQLIINIIKKSENGVKNDN